MSFHIPDELNASLVWIWSYHPAFSGVINQAPLVFTVTEADEYKAQIKDRHVEFARWFLNDINDYKQIAGVMLHETMHYMLNHSELHFAWFTAREITGRLRDGTVVTCSYHEIVVQHALDYSINDGLIRMGVSLPKDRLHEPHVFGGWMDAEEDIYVRVYKQYQSEGKLPQDGPGQPCQQGQPGQGQPYPQAGSGSGVVGPKSSKLRPCNPCPEDGVGAPIGAGGGDVLPYDPRTIGNDPGHKAEIVRREITKHFVEKSRGSSAGDIEKLLQRIAPKRFPWVEVVKPRFQDLLGRSKPTWRRVNRSAMAIRTILEGREGVRAGKVLLIADTSGSIGHKEQENFVENTIYLMEDCRPKELWFLEIDTHVRRKTRVTHLSELKRFIQPMRDGRTGLYGGGGTDMCAAWTWMREEKYTPDIVLVLTDGYTPFPDEIHPAKEVIWIMTTEIVAPAHAGRTARMFL